MLIRYVYPFSKIKYSFSYFLNHLILKLQTRINVLIPETRSFAPVKYQLNYDDKTDQISPQWLKCIQSNPFNQNSVEELSHLKAVQIVLIPAPSHTSSTDECGGFSSFNWYIHIFNFFIRWKSNYSKSFQIPYAISTKVELPRKNI